MTAVNFMRRRASGVGFFIESDPTDDELTLLGLSLAANGLNLTNTGKVINMVPGTAGTDGVNLDQLQQAVINGGTVKELLLCQDQLENTEGIRAAAIMYFTAVPTAAELFQLDDGATTRQYGADSGGDVQFVIAGSAVDTMINLAAAITGDGSGLWNAVFTADGFDHINADGVVVIYERLTSAGDSTSRMFGNTQNTQIVEYAAGGTVDLDYSETTNAALPGADPAEGRFGLQREQVALVDGEIHNVLKDNSLYSWDDSQDMWNVLSGASSIPDATSGSGGAIKGKLTVDSDTGLLLTAGVLTMVLESDGAIVFDGSNKGLEINLETSNPTLDIGSNELGVKFSTSAGGLEAVAAGLKVKVDGATIQINGSGELEVIGATDAEKVENEYAVHADGVVIGDPVFFSGNDEVRPADADPTALSGDTAEKVFGIAIATQTNPGNVGIVSEGPVIGAISGATAGTPYYLADGGGLTTSAPSGANDNVAIGYAEDATTLYVQKQIFARGR